MKPAKKPPAQPSPKLARMLQAATPQQREEAIRIAAKLLAIKAAENKAPTPGMTPETPLAARTTT